MLSNLRSSSLLALFLDALTRGGPGGLPRPIELHAHDPQRYVSDMLAWVHQATAGEREFLESLFGSPRGAGRMIGAARGGETDAGRDEKGKAPGDEEEELVRDMLDRDLEGCCRPLRVRPSQVSERAREVTADFYVYRSESSRRSKHRTTLSRAIGSSISSNSTFLQCGRPSALTPCSHEPSKSTRGYHPLFSCLLGADKAVLQHPRCLIQGVLRHAGCPGTVPSALPPRESASSDYRQLH